MDGINIFIVMGWLDKLKGKEKPSEIEVQTFTAYTITGLHPDLKKENWTNSQFDELTETEVAYIKKLAQELTGRVFLKNQGEHSDLIRGYHPSCDAGRPDLFLGRQIKSKAITGSITKTNGVVTSISVPLADGTTRKVTSEQEIQRILNELGH